MDRRSAASDCSTASDSSVINMKGSEMFNVHVLAYYVEIERDLEKRARFIVHWKKTIADWKLRTRG